MTFCGQKKSPLKKKVLYRSYETNLKVMNENDTISDQIRECMRLIKICPLCGSNNIKTKVSFKGRLMYRNKRETQYCSCGWARIVPTEREAMIELGLI